MWKTQSMDLTVNEMATMDFCLPELSATKTVTW